jgi:hypothetical protein
MFSPVVSPTEACGTVHARLFGLAKPRAQWKSAMAGNTTMQIWLGKQLLGQRDRHEVDAQVTGDIHVTVTLVSTKPRVIEGERSTTAPVGPWDDAPR